MKWKARAPANIALIKYIGKKENKKPFDFKNYQHKEEEFLSLLSSFSFLKALYKIEPQLKLKNQAVNPSLSYTLEHFFTEVEIEENPSQNLSQDGCEFFENNTKISYSEHSSDRFLIFFHWLKTIFSIPGYYKIFSCNNFPHSAGAASSASSFAALTLSTYQLAQSRSRFPNKINSLNQKTLSVLSRLGSGSSCRSFFSPWALWEDQRVKSLSFPFTKLYHQFLIADPYPKKISSTEAHYLVKSSPYFLNREKRAKQRIQSLTQALKNQDWRQCFLISKEEFLDMHNLFETASPSFIYRNSYSYEIQEEVEKLWEIKKDGPLITLDASANVHLLYRTDQMDLIQLIKEKFCFKLKIISHIV